MSEVFWYILTQTDLACDSNVDVDGGLVGLINDTYKKIK